VVVWASRAIRQPAGGDVVDGAVEAEVDRQGFVPAVVSGEFGVGQDDGGALERASRDQGFFFS
jgi:hypothetical protein